MVNKILYKLSIIVLTLAVITILYFYYLFLYPVKTLEFRKNLQTTKSVYCQGEQLEYISSYCKYRTMSCNVVRKFVNDIVYTLPPLTTSHPTGCRDITISTTKVPRELPPGKYYFELDIFCKVNHFRDVEREARTNSFLVLPYTDASCKNIVPEDTHI